MAKWPALHIDKREFQELSQNVAPRVGGYVEIFTVLMNGDVVSFAKAPNHHSYAPNIWRALGAFYRMTDPSHDILSDPGLKSVFVAVGSGKMSRAHDLLVGSTYDFVWIRKDGLADLVKAQKEFCEQHCFDVSPQRINRILRETIPEIGDANVEIGMSFENAVKTTAAFVEKAMEDVSGLKGIAFNMCSEVKPFWFIDDEVVGRRPYNIYMDGEQKATDYKGKAAWELLWALEDQTRIQQMRKYQ